MLFRDPIFILTFVSIVAQYECLIYKNVINEHQQTNKIPLEIKKYCNLRGSYFNAQIWEHWSGYECYFYTPDYRLNFIYPAKNYNLRLGNENFTIPISEIDENGDFFWYDYKNETSKKYLRNSFNSDYYFELWMDCAEEAVKCCLNSMTNENIVPTNEYPCPTIWDGWSCFPSTKRDSVSKLPCPKFAYSTDANVCVLESEKECYFNKTLNKWLWNPQTNYEVCGTAPLLRARHDFHIIFLSTAIAFTLPSIVLLVSFRKFRTTTRWCLHRNLLIMTVLKNALTIMSKKLIILDALQPPNLTNNVMDNNGIACRVLAFLENAAKNGIFACMLVDGFYLHKTIARSFANEPNIILLYIIDIVLSFTPSLIWAGLRASNDAQDCWMIDTSGAQWVIDGFRLAILIINIGFLVDIVRVMVTKMKMRSISKQTKTTLKATVFLIPLFGLPILITSSRSIIPGNSCKSEDIFYYLSYSLESIQGMTVALLFCYLNSEVHQEICKLFIYLEQKFGWNLKRDRLFNQRRTTAATFVQSNGNS